MYKLILSTHLFVGKLCEMDTWNTDSSCSNWRRQNGEVKNGRWSFLSYLMVISYTGWWEQHVM